MGQHDAAVGGGVEQRVRDAGPHGEVAFDRQRVCGEAVHGLQVEPVGQELHVEGPLAVHAPPQRDPARAALATHPQVVEGEDALVHVPVGLADGEALPVELGVGDREVGFAVHVEQRPVEPQAPGEVAFQALEVDEHPHHVLDAALVDVDGGLHRDRRAEVDGVPALVAAAPELGLRVLEGDGLEPGGVQVGLEHVGVLDPEDLEVAQGAVPREDELVERAHDVAPDVAGPEQADVGERPEVGQIGLREVEVQIEGAFGAEADVDPCGAAVAGAPDAVRGEQDVVLLEEEPPPRVRVRQVQQVLRVPPLEGPVAHVEIGHAEVEVAFDAQRLEGAAARDLDVPVEVDPRRGRGVELLEERQQAHVLGRDVPVFERELPGDVPAGDDAAVSPGQDDLLDVDAFARGDGGRADLAELVREQGREDPGDVEAEVHAGERHGQRGVLRGAFCVQVEVEGAVRRPRRRERGVQLLEVDGNDEVRVELPGERHPGAARGVEHLQVELELGELHDLGAHHDLAEEQLGGLLQPAVPDGQRAVDAGLVAGGGQGVDALDGGVAVGELEADGAVDDPDPGEGEALERAPSGARREVLELAELALLVEVQEHRGTLQQELADPDPAAIEHQRDADLLRGQDGLAVVGAEHVEPFDLGARRPEVDVHVGERDGLAELGLEDRLDELDGAHAEVVGPHPADEDREHEDDGERRELATTDEQPPQAAAARPGTFARALSLRGRWRHGGGGGLRGLGRRWRGLAHPPPADCLSDTGGVSRGDRSFEVQVERAWGRSWGVERVTRIELATPSLGSLCSTS